MEEIVFPNQLRMLRRVRGCRMIELAELLGLTISALSKIEKGYRRLNEEQLQKVAKFNRQKQKVNKFRNFKLND